MLNHCCSPARRFLLPSARKRCVLEPSSGPGHHSGHLEELENHKQPGEYPVGNGLESLGNNTKSVAGGHSHKECEARLELSGKSPVPPKPTRERPSSGREDGFHTGCTVINCVDSVHPIKPGCGSVSCHLSDTVPQNKAGEGL